MDTVSLFGVAVARETMAEAVAFLRQSVTMKRQVFCAFVNADCLNQAYVNPAYVALLGRADRVWADGVGVAIAARHHGQPVPENVNGTDLFPLLCREKFSIYLLGARPGVAAAAMANARALYGADIVGAHDGFFAGRDAEVIAEINRLRPDILLVALGVPAQETWIVQHLSELDCRAAIGVGGLLDFVSGRIPRAPLWMRKCKLEWCYRLYHEPVRLFRRYVIGNPLFLWRVFTGRSAR